jgi:DNA modification methylase
MLDINTIHCMDAFDGLKQVKTDSIDLVVTDPPYNIASDHKKTKQGNRIVSTREAWGAWDTYHPFDYDVMLMRLLLDDSLEQVQDEWIEDTLNRKLPSFQAMLEKRAVK